VSIAAGERLTELQACRPLLLRRRTTSLPFCALGRRLGRPVCARMNATARSLGMTHTATPTRAASTTQPCRLPPTRCALSIARCAAGVREHRRHTERDAAGRRSVHNTNTFSAQNGLSASRPARDDGAGGCFAFRAISWIDGKRRTITGVVLGQPATTGSAGSRGRRRHGRTHAGQSQRRVPAMPGLRPRSLPLNAPSLRPNP